METMRTTGEEYFYSIPGLGVPKHEVRASLVDDIEFFADWIPKNADNLPFLLEHHLEAFMAQMKMLHEILVSIYALWLARDVSRILTVAENTRKAMCSKQVEPFITNAHNLAIEIQLAKKNMDSPRPEVSHNSSHYDEIERYKDVTKSIKVISELLAASDDNPDFEKISNIAENIDELKGSKLAIPLLASIKLRNIKRLKKTLAEILTVYFGKIDATNCSATKSSEMKKIVIVDDMAEILASLTLMLETHYQVLPLSEGKEVLEFIDSGQSTDAFILDIDMPIMDGLTLAKNIREREQHIDTPIFFLTSNSEKETVIRAWRYNIKAFIVKPVNKETIISKLSSCLS